MSRKKKAEHWAFDELRKRLLEGKEGDTILLFEPSLKARIYDNFYNYLYPKIVGAFENSQLQINKIDEIKLIEHTTFEPSCVAYLSINDPKRLFGISEEKWWHIGFELKITEEKYLLDPRLSIRFPYWMESDWILDFIIDSRKWNTKPHISADHEWLNLSFEDGTRKYSYFRYNFDDDDELKVTLETFNRSLSIAKAIDLFAENPTNRFLKSHMLQVIREMYEG
jgi:hypothetical protein